MKLRAFRKLLLLSATLASLGALLAWTFSQNPHGVAPLLAITVLAGIGIFTRIKKPGSVVASRFLWWTLALAGYLMCVYGTFVLPVGRSLDIWNKVFIVPFFALPPAFLAFSLALAEVRTGLSRVVTAVSWVFTVAFSLLRWVGVFEVEFFDTGIKRTAEPTLWYLVSLAAVQIFIWYGLFEVYRCYRRLVGGRSKRRLRTFLVAMCLANVLAYLNVLLSMRITVYPLSALVLAAYGLVMADLIIRRKFLDVEIVIRKATYYLTYSLSVTVGYLALLFLVTFLMKPLMLNPGYVTHGIVILAIAFIAVPLRLRIQEVIDRRFFRERYDRRRALLALADGLPAIMDLESLVKTVLEALVQAVKLERGAIYLAIDDSIYQHLELVSRKTYDDPVESLNEGGQADVLELSRESMRFLCEARRRPLLLTGEEERDIGEGDSVPAGLTHFAKSRDYEVALPVASDEKLLAIVFLGRKLSELPLSSEDADLLRTIAGEAYVAFDNAGNYEAAMSMQRYNKSILHSLDTGLITVGPDGRLAAANPAAERIFGKEASDLVGKSYADVFEASTEIEALVGDALGGDHVSAREVTYGEKTLNVTTTDLTGGEGEASGALLAFGDITETQRLQELVRRKERLALLGEMAAGVAHEIKNPITSIGLLASALPRRVGDEKFLRTVADVIPTEVKRLDFIVHGLLDYARPSKLTKVDVDMNAVTKAAVDALRPELGEVGASIAERYEDNIPSVKAEGEKMKQVVINLVKNAVEAVDGSQDKCIGVRVHRTGAEVAVSVSDSGPGIDEKKRGRIFHAFFSTKEHGTGLGLAISHRIVVDHGGRIEVDSSPGKGSVFTVFLPGPTH